MIAAPTFSQIKAQVTAILHRSNGSKVIGIHAQGRWTSDRQQHDGDQCYLIDQCDSPLALRIALQKGQQERAAGDNVIQVLITPIPEGELAEDILIRLVKQRLFTIDSWQIVKSLFRATNVDPRLVQHQWIPEALMDWMPANRYSPVMGGFLDAEIVWPLLMQHGLHLNVERPDLPAILQWSTDPDHIERYYQASEDFQIAVCNWLSNLAGPAVKTVLQCVEHNHQLDALPLGLAASVVYHPDTQNKLDKAIGKLEERFLAGLTPQTNTMHIWSEAAQQALKLLPVDIQKTLIQRSDTILEAIGAAAFAYLSPVSEHGFNQYLTDLSKHLTTHIQKPTQSTLNTLIQTYHSVQQHQQAILYPQSRRYQRMAMAMRLAQWLIDATNTSLQHPKSLEAAISYHTQEGSFLDWARLMLPIAEPHRELATAYGKLFDAVTARRENQSHQFAKLLKDWIAIGSTRKSVLPVEHILETVVAPLAANNPVLLLVMDGMSLAVAHELIADLTKQTWQLITPNTQDLPIQPGLAAIPSETSVSRASLLCGQLTQGQQNQEKKGFTKHSDLLQHSKPSAPPLLFHKDALQSIRPPILSGDVQTTLATDKHQVVGLVINAVDDLLAKGDQVDIVWNCDRIKVLQPILQAASNAKRIIILTSDHGHVIHNGTEYQSPKGKERWRTDNGKPTPKELQLTGERVVAPNGNSIIVPWTEKLRYCTSKKNGYHGGINPQEMIVPIAVLTSDTPPENWQFQNSQTPEWWSIAQSETYAPTQAANLHDKSFQPELGPLFSYAESLETRSSSTQTPTWVTQLLKSPIYKTQLKAVGTDQLPEEHVIQILSVLDSLNGKTTLPELTFRLGNSPESLHLTLSSLQKALNIEGYLVIIYEVKTGNLILDIPLLQKQFDIEIA